MGQTATEPRATEATMQTDPRLKSPMLCQLSYRDQATPPQHVTPSSPPAPPARRGKKSGKADAGMGETYIAVYRRERAPREAERQRLLRECARELDGWTVPVAQQRLPVGQGRRRTRRDA